MVFQRLLKDFGWGTQATLSAVQAVQIMDICGSSAFQLDENTTDTVTAHKFACEVVHHY